MRTVRASLSDSDLVAYTASQLNSMFPDGRSVASDTLLALLPAIMERLEHCFTQINNKYFFDGSDALFNHLHGDHYAMFLYWAANTAFHANASEGLASKLFLLNKALHGIDAFYEVELPSVFLFVHPLATVLGRGRYSDHLLVYQRCGVGSNHGVYPQLGRFVTLRPGSSVLGNCRIGRNCTIAAESLVLDHDLPDDCVYIGNPRQFIVRPAGELPPIWRT